MIELLIVITVIAILASLLLGGVQSAMGRARVAAVVSEIKNLEKAVKDFNAEFGTDPPSFIILYESTTSDTNGWNTSTGPTAADTRASRAFIRQLWKDFNFGSSASPVSVDINGNGNTNDVLYLNGAECLVFFLGGLMDKSSSVPVPKGFSKVSSSPFGSLLGAQGSRSGFFYEFNSKQLVDLDNDGMYEYLDSIPGQTMPIQYFSSYGGTGYRPLGRDVKYQGTSTCDDEVLPNTLMWVYTKNAGSASTAASPFNPNGFQLISPGLNTDFGGQNSGGNYHAGGYLDPEKGVQIGTTYAAPSASPPVTLVRDGQLATLERDNITNFTGGEIH